MMMNRPLGYCSVFYFPMYRCCSWKSSANSPRHCSHRAGKASTRPSQTLESSLVITGFSQQLIGISRTPKNNFDLWRPRDNTAITGEGDKGSFCGHSSLHCGLLPLTGGWHFLLYSRSHVRFTLLQVFLGFSWIYPGAWVHDAADQLDGRRRTPHEHCHRGDDLWHR